MKSEKPRISMKVLYLLLIWFIIIGVGTYVAANPQVKSAQTDKKKYSPGERVNIVGQASEADSLMAELVMPDGSKVLLVPRLEKDFFSLNFTTSLEGIYNLSLVANALVFGFVPKSSSSFTLSIPVFDNPSISLNYSKVAKTGSQISISILARDTSQVARVLVEYDGMNSTIPVLAGKMVNASCFISLKNKEGIQNFRVFAFDKFGNYAVENGSIIVRAYTSFPNFTTVFNLANQTALTVLPPSAGVRVYLWNTTCVPYMVIGQADVDANGKVTFSEVPSHMWSNTKYAISANLTWNGVDKGVLLLEKATIYDGTGTTGAYGNLTDLLLTYSHFTPSGTYRKKDETHDYVIVLLSPFTFQVKDESGYPATGASIQAFLNLTTHEVLDFGAKFVNGTFGSEFIGIMPGAGKNLKVGWVEFVLPAPCTTSGTTFKNITLLVRYKAKDPANGPVVGRILITGFTGFNTVPVLNPYQAGGDYDAEPGSNKISDLKIVSYNELTVNIKWIDVEFLDIMGNFWPTRKAEIAFKWYENPNGAYPYGGSTYDFGKAIVRIPSTLNESGSAPTGSYNFAPFNFTLTYGVEWFFMIVGEGQAKPSIITSPYPIKTMMVKLTGIKMVFSRDIPESQRNDFELELFLPAAISGHGMEVSVSWITSRECYLIPPERSNGSIWWPSKDIGQINFQAWFQGIKVLDTGVQGVIPAGVTPLSLTEDDYNTEKVFNLTV